MPSPDPALTLTQSAHWLTERGVSVDRRAMRRWVDNGIVTAHRVGFRDLIARSELERLLADTPWAEDELE